MTPGSRMPSWKERENNKKRERRRRAIAAKIFAGLRMYGNYKLPKHCDNNEVLKALCNEAGWTVELDGTTYRQGCKPPERMDNNLINGGSASATATVTASACSSYQQSPTSSSFPSPISSSSYAPPPLPNGTSLIPWLKNLSSNNSINKFPTSLHHHINNNHGGSISAPVTSPLSSPRIMTTWDHSILHSSTPPSPGHQNNLLPSGSDWSVSPIPATFSFVSSTHYPFEFNASGSGSGSRMWTPGQSGTSSPVVRAGDVRMSEAISNEFAFGCNMSGMGMGMSVDGLVKPWEGERIHEECGSDDLELTLGCSKTR